MTEIQRLGVKIFADGADVGHILALARNPLIKGFTTNPTLMHKAGITDYEGFARKLLDAIRDRPISFEVFSDELPEMAAQARVIASWGPNVYVKIPVSNTRGLFTGPILRELTREGIAVNVTAVMTVDQVRSIVDCLAAEAPAVVSVFAGRIADTGRDPVPMMAECVRMLRARPRAELLWASPRELLNLFHAEQVGCHIITMTADLLGKLDMVGRDLAAYSLDTVQMFRRDAMAAGFSIRIPAAAAE